MSKCLPLCWGNAIFTQASVIVLHWIRLLGLNLLQAFGVEFIFSKWRIFTKKWHNHIISIIFIVKVYLNIVLHFSFITVRLNIVYKIEPVL